MDNRLQTLIEMHTYCRPMGSRAEEEFVNRYIKKLPGAEEDSFGNLHVVIGIEPSVLFSCHMDTVHRRSGRQKVYYNAKTGELKLHNRAFASNCLGADDTAGVFICREMILAGVPGHYVFHYGEERGGKGSSAVTEAYPEFFKRYKAAIAFDRRNFGDVITHQGWSKTASNEFARDLADKLNATSEYFNYKPSDGGVYTDTKEYAHLIPECTNLSVGYQEEHRSTEKLWTANTLLLLDAMVKLDWSTLVIKRDVTDDGWEDRRGYTFYGETPGVTYFFPKTRHCGGGYYSGDKYYNKSTLNRVKNEGREAGQGQFYQSEGRAEEVPTVDAEIYDDESISWFVDFYRKADAAEREEMKDWLEPEELALVMQKAERVLALEDEIARMEAEAPHVYLTSEIAQVQEELTRQLKMRQGTLNDVDD